MSNKFLLENDLSSSSVEPLHLEQLLPKQNICYRTIFGATVVVVVVVVVVVKVVVVVVVAVVVEGKLDESDSSGVGLDTLVVNGKRERLRLRQVTSLS